MEDEDEAVEDEEEDMDKEEDEYERMTRTRRSIRSWSKRSVEE